MTERLYYHDSFRREFDAHVLSCEAAGPAPDGARAGERWLMELDRSAFYPTSGGQPYDTGRLGSAGVLEVYENPEGKVIHVTDGPLPLGPAHGAIDWERRFDHMQQHTGQHLVSAAFVQLFKLPTVSFHLGRDTSTIDLAATSLNARQLEEAERLANQVVFEDRAVEIGFATAEQLAEEGVRKAVDRQGILRVIAVENFDRQPCGGTHVSRTGQIGLILLRKFEKQKGNWRVEFVCGARAMRIARNDYALLGEAARELGCGMPEVPQQVRKTLEERQAAHRAGQGLLEQLAAYEAVELLAAADATAAPGRPRIIARAFETADSAYLRLLATKLVAHPDLQVLLATWLGGHVVFAQSAGLQADMNAALRAALRTAGGKGGGTRDFAQGSVPDSALLNTVLAYAVAHLKG